MKEQLTKLQPNQSITTGMAAGALTSLIVWGLNAYLAAGIPGEVGIWASIVLTYAAQQWREKRG